MKVTTEGEKVVDLLWDVIAAKGFEKEMVFEMAARDIRALPKLEGTVHVNIALILKFLAELPLPPRRLPRGAGGGPTRRTTLFLFDQGPASGLGKIRFHDFGPAFEAFDLPNVALFREQIGGFAALLARQRRRPRRSRRTSTSS